jgi:hypothetical protein
VERVAFDTETGLITRKEPTPPLVSVAFAWAGGDELLHHSDPALEGLVEELLTHHVLTGFFTCYDLAIIGNTWPHMIPLLFIALAEGRIKNCRTRERMLDIAWGEGTRRKYNLGIVCGRRGGEVDKSDPWRKRFIELYYVPIKKWPKEAVHYARNDVIHTFELDQLQEGERFGKIAKKDVDWLVDEDNQMRAEWALTLQSYFGIVTRQEAAQALDARLMAEFEEVKQRLLEGGLVRPDGSRDTKVAMAMAGCSGATVRTTRGFSLAEAVLTDLKLPKGHLLLDYQRYGSIMTTRSRWVSQLKSPLLRTRYEVLVDTGRTSASDPPIQQLPREGGFRECIGADEGNLLIVSDYKGAELVTHAQDCLDLFPRERCRLAEVLNAGEDPHGYLGADVMKVPYKKFMRLYKGGDAVAGKMRQGAKPGNFGFPVGMGINRFIQYAKDDYGVEVTESEAKNLKQVWLHRFPENVRYLAEHKKIHHRGKPIKQFWSGRYRGGCSFTEGCNTRFQGRAADGGKLAMWRVAWRQWMEPESDLYGTDTTMFVHDELVVESPEDQAEDAREELDEVMIEAFEEVCPDMKVRTDSHITDRYAKP